MFESKNIILSMASTSKQQDDSGIYNLTVGTEVSAKYRGAFCEAQIKSLKKNVQYKVLSKKTGKSCQLSEESIKGVLKIGVLVEAQFPDQPFWQECTIQNVKDRSLYTVVFDDGDERTLSRGSLCLKGDRHYAKSETLDNLPLTDPENFGTPVLGSKKNRRRRPAEDEYGDESEDHRIHEHETAKVKDKKRHESNEQETSSEDDEDDNEKRKRWLADPLMGRVVIVEPNDKRKHWFPGLVVNPLCYERHQDLTSGHLVVRSFKTGKFLRVSRASVKEMATTTIPAKLDSVWKGIVEDAQEWQKTRTVSERWRMDIKEILDDSDDDDDDEKSDEEVLGKKKEEKKLYSESEEDVTEKEEEKKNHDFLEVMYKFMDDRGTPINKTPVLGYKDLDLFLLYKLVQKRHDSFSIISIKEWKQIYLDLGIPKPNPAAGHNVRTAYAKYLGAYEEYCASWKHIPVSKKITTVKSPTLLGSKEKGKIKAEKNTKDGSRTLQEARKIKVKDNLPRIKSLESGINSNPKGRISPIITVASTADSPVFSQQRRSGQRRRVSESSSASDVTPPLSSGKAEKIKPAKGNQLKKPDEKFRSPGGPDSEPDENSRFVKIEKKEAELSVDSVAAKRIRRNSTSNVSTQYSVGDKLKVKYGHGKTYKLYDAKVMQLKPPDGPGEAIEYLVHYAGWNARHDELIRHVRIVGFAEDKGSVTSSPVAGTAKPVARRPKTPISSRGTVARKDDIVPSPGSSYSLSSRFSSNVDDLSHLKDDLPELPIKTRVPSVLKKNLVGDIMKALSSQNTVGNETKRPTSPVLVSSQRTKQKMTSVSEPVPKPPSKLTTETQIKKEDTASRVADNAGSIDAKEDVDVEVDKKPTNIVDEISKEEKPKLPASGLDNKTDVKVKLNKSDRESSVSSSEESLSPIGEAIDDNANEQRVGTPVQQVRRTSRRSKSPAYLTESAWISKRKKYSTASVEKSLSPSPTVDKKEVVQMQDPTEDSLPVPTQRTSSPTPSTQSSTSLSSSEETNSNSKDASPVLSAITAKVSKTRTKSRRKVHDKLKSNTNQQEVKNTPDDDGKQKPDNTQTTEYDNFDDEAPSIALEKHHETDQPATEINSESEQLGAGTSKSDSPSHANEDTQQSYETSTKSENPTKNISDAGENRRKIRKRKPPTDDYESLVKDKAEQTQKPKFDDKAEQTQKPKFDDKAEQTQKPKFDDKAEQMQKPKFDELISTDGEDTLAQFGQKQPTQSQDANNEIESNEVPSTSNHDSIDSPRNLPSPPENPPSSSKVLLENTPPTTPEHSPNYISEDQDVEPGKSSPNVYSDDMNGEEHKDSAGNTSSSGCEHLMSSDKGTHSQAKDERGDEDDKEENSGSPARKKRRGSSRKRTTSKGRGNRRSSYINDQDTESEEDQDNETNRRKSHDSGGRCKPRKKRTKVRPEPPTAPPPLPMEKLESMTQDERISFLQDRMAEMRTVYHQLKQEVANIDRKRKRAKRREREAAEAAQLSSKSGPSSLMPTKEASSAARKEEAMMALLACTAADVQDYRM